MLLLWQPFYCKNSFRRGKQCYKCQSCGYQFVDGFCIDNGLLVSEYIEGKQPLAQLSFRYGVDKSTIWRHLKSMRHIRVISMHKDVVINMDTTYWGRNFGLLVIKDAFHNKILWYKFVRHESVADYVEGVGWLRENRFLIYGIVCDGMRGLFQALRSYPVQMCQFHQMMIVRRFLTNNPELPAARELLGLTRTGKGQFCLELDRWHDRWRGFLKERTRKAGVQRTRYKHQRLRSAYLSFKRNMPCLWTFQDYPQLHIPNTNNAQEGVFTDIKTKLRVHAGITKDRRIKLIQEYIARH